MRVSRPVSSQFESPVRLGYPTWANSCLRQQVTGRTEFSPEMKGYLILRRRFLPIAVAPRDRYHVRPRRSLGLQNLSDYLRGSQQGHRARRDSLQYRTCEMAGSQQRRLVLITPQLATIQVPEPLRLERSPARGVLQCVITLATHPQWRKSPGLGDKWTVGLDAIEAFSDFKTCPGRAMTHRIPPRSPHC